MALSKIDGTNLIAPTIPVASGGTGSATLAGAGLANTPGFFASLTSNQSIAHNTTTKIQFNSELYDTDNTYDNSSNYRWTPGVAGKVFIGYQLHSANHTDYGYSYIYKNGTQIQQSVFHTGNDVDVTMLGFATDVTDADDYYEIFWKQTKGSSANVQGNTDRDKTFFYGYKLIG